MASKDLAREIDPDRVAIYIRWSTEDQGEGTTLEVQMEACRNYIQSQGWTVNPALVFIDEGWSGAALDRPALTKLRKAVDEEQVDCVVVFKMDRLSRSVLDTVRLVLDEWDDRCYVKSAREPIDTTSQSGRMFFYMLTSYAEWERATIKDRTHSGRLKRAQEGRNPGFTPPYGYRVGQLPGAVEVVPEEAAVVRRIFDLYSQGVGVYRISMQLNQEGIPFTRAKRGDHWKPPTIKYMLRNRTYMGELNWGLRAPNPKRKRNPNEPLRLVRDEPQVSVKGALPVIIPPALFNLCHEVRRSKPRPGQGMTGRWTQSDYLLTGLVHCDFCGAMLKSKAASGRTIYDYYICTTRYERGHDACPGGLIRQNDLDAAVLQQVTQRFLSPGARQSHVQWRQQRLQEALEAIKAQIADHQGRIARMEAQKAKLRQEYRDEVLTVTDYKEMRGDIEREQLGLHGQLRTLEEERRSVEASLASLPTWAEHMNRLERWDQLTPNERKHLLRRFVDSVLVFQYADGTACGKINWASGYSEEDMTPFQFDSHGKRRRHGLRLGEMAD